jgi:AcrR family transcriptional regulator
MSKVTRQEIIDAAISLFSQNGYHAASMQDVARALGIQKPSLYHHFDSKEAILLAILENGMERLTGQLEEIAASDQDCVSKLRAAIQAQADAIASNPPRAAVFLREDRGLGDGYMAQYLAKSDRVQHFFRVIVQQGIDAGVFRATDVSITAQALLGAVNWMTRWYHPAGRLGAPQIADQFADLFLNGLSRAIDD